MAISVDPLTHIISVPKADLTLVQTSPEVRSLDLDEFRRWLKAWEDDEEGIIQPKTHRHNTEVALSGLNYARIVEVLDPYTVKFEDGQYTVNCTGANHNIADIRVPNQVSIIVNNAAGLINNSAIEYASFNGGVIVDVVNGTSGTLFPKGTIQAPVDNITDALLIANFRGLSTIYVNSNLDINGGSDLDGFHIVGQNHVSIVITINTSAEVNNLRVEQCYIKNSTFDGDVSIWDSTIGDSTYVDGHIRRCGTFGTITLGGNTKCVLSDCYTIDQDNSLIIDMNGSGNDLAMPNYCGLVTVKNLTSATEEIGIGLNGGGVTLDSTITAGTIIVSGTGILVDNSTGTAIVNTDGLMSTSTVAEAVWSEAMSDHQTPGSMGANQQHGVTSLGS